jgi:hypothetical protein
MEACEALRALLRGKARKVVVRAATSLLLRTSSRREAAAAATLLWSIAYNPAAASALIDMDVVQALLTTARKQEKDNAVLRAVLGALDALLLKPKVRAQRGTHCSPEGRWELFHFVRSCIVSRAFSQPQRQ